ncbi:tetratricopeptide repeat protein [Sorangium cellulosum]|uniref:tetratricopeptide repeat protein n=1 Tax=Sorangium cellulosum TaxID=56 RepID=UPI00133133D0|nr:hypothetical protein [Sorangium cellulosum]
MIRSPPALALLVALLASDDAPVAGPLPAPPSAPQALALEAEIAGCSVVLAGPVCELPRDTTLRVWVKAPEGAHVEAATDTRPLPVDGTPIQGGLQLRLEVPAGARALVVTAARGEARAERRWTLRPFQPDAALEEAEDLRQRGELDEAARRLDALRADPDPARRTRALGKLARIDLARGDVDAAVQRFEQTIPAHLALGRISDALHDSFAEAYTLLLRRRELAGARRVLDRLDPYAGADPEGDTRRAYYAGLLSYEAGDVRATLQRFRAAVEGAERLGLDEQRLDVLQLEALVLQELGRGAEGEVLLREVAEAFPADARPCRRAAMLTNLGAGDGPSPEALDAADGALTTTIPESVTDAAYGSYPAVGLLDLDGPRCAATLIDEQHVLTTHGCMLESGIAPDVSNHDPRHAFVLYLQPDATGRATIRQTRLTLDRWHGFLKGDRLTDVAVVRLASRAVVAAGGGAEEQLAVPAPLASAAPSSSFAKRLHGKRTTIGFAGGQAGVKRMALWEGAWSVELRRECLLLGASTALRPALTIDSSPLAVGKGDSGGPTFDGSALEALIVAPGGDAGPSFADPVILQKQIADVIAGWGGAVGPAHRYTSFVPLVVHDDTPSGATSALETGFETVLSITNTDTKAADIAVEFSWDQLATNGVGPAAASNPLGVHRAQERRGLAPNATFQLSTAGFPAGFEGSAVVHASRHVAVSVAYVPRTATSVVNVPRGTAVPAASADHSVYLPTAVKNTYGHSSVIAVQNASEKPVDVEISLRCADGSCGAGAVATIEDLPAHTARIIDLHTAAWLSRYDQVNAAAKIKANLADDPARPAPVAVFALELGYPGSLRPRGAAMYEGVEGSRLRGSRGGKLHLATALCDAFDARTTYALMNASELPQALSVDYLDLSGNVRATADGASIPPYTKESFLACSASVGPGFSGSGTAYAAGALVGVGKAAADAPGAVYVTAFRDVHEGSSRLVFPEVSWHGATDGYDATLALQNVGDTPADLKVTFYDQAGGIVDVVTHAGLQPGAKVSVAADVAESLSRFETLEGFRGSAVVEAADKSDRIAGIVRLTRTDTRIPSSHQIVGEEYSGIPLDEITLVAPDPSAVEPNVESNPSCPTCPSCFAPEAAR